MNMPQQYSPSVQEIRHSLCSQLIGAGLKTAPEIVDTAKAIEDYVFGTKSTFVPEAQTSTKEAKTTTSKTEKKDAVKQEKTTEVVAEQEATTETTEQSKIEPADVKAALMRVAKADRDAFLAIMAKFNAPNVPAIQPEDFQAVIAEVEKFEAENA
ncbi:hypothetical protein [Acinetobacter sp. 1125_18A]|uniref:hypothetical protein n=1 Tax=Acinetobacter sp. 1125_18A TaxID=2605959 RepID=UPI00405816F0